MKAQDYINKALTGSDTLQKKLSLLDKALELDPHCEAHYHKVKIYLSHLQGNDDNQTFASLAWKKSATEADWKFLFVNLYRAMVIQISTSALNTKTTESKNHFEECKKLFSYFLGVTPTIPSFFIKPMTTPEFKYYFSIQDLSLKEKTATEQAHDEKATLFKTISQLDTYRERHKAYWECLCPESVLGQIFYRPTEQDPEPSTRSGSLGKIFSVLMQDIKTHKTMHIQSSSVKSVANNSALLQQLESHITGISQKLKTQLKEFESAEEKSNPDHYHEFTILGGFSTARVNFWNYKPKHYLAKSIATPEGHRVPSWEELDKIATDLVKAGKSDIIKTDNTSSEPKSLKKF